MKELIYLVLIFMFSLNVSGQPAVEKLLKARALKEEGKTDMAISQLTDAISGSNDSRLYVERAEAKMMKGDYSGAISDYNEANKITAGSGEYGLSRIYALKGDASTSLYHLEQNLGSAFRKGEKEVMLDPAFGAIETRPEWRQFWKKERYSDLEEDISQIEYYISAGKIDESISVFSELKNNYQYSDDSFYAQALISLASGKTADAVKIAADLSTQNPGNIKYLRLLAKAQTASGNPAGASLTYSGLISSGVDDARLLMQRAECYKKTGENDKALSDIKKFLEYYPASKEALSQAGKVEEATGDNIAALEFFSKNLKLHPGDAECYVDRADSYFVSKSWNWAAKDYSMALDLNPANSDVWLNIGISMLNSGNPEEACHDFRKSFSLGNKRASEYISRNCIK
jgi:tetratricopeptide (TPR) repeat protein